MKNWVKRYGTTLINGATITKSDQSINFGRVLQYALTLVGFSLTLVGFSNMMRTGQLLCRISERCVPCFRKSRHMVRWWWVRITLSIARPVTLRSVNFLKSRDSVTAV